MRDKTVISLDLGRLIAGAMYRGQFEERLKEVIKAVEDENGSVILLLMKFTCCWDWAEVVVVEDQWRNDGRI